VGLNSGRLTAPLNGTNLWIHPGTDFDRNWSAFAADADAPFPLLFISFPSAKDPSFEQRHPGHQTLEVVAPAPYGLFSRWGSTAWKRRGESYDALKGQLEARLLAGLRRHVPGVAGAVEHCELSTPLSTRHFANASRGEMYGLAHSPGRFECRGLRPSTPIGNLFLTGADVSTCGVAGALAGAMTTASVMLRRSMFGVAAKAERTPSVERAVRSAA
jgi:all-trans-retinol 13,14-reductase